MIGRGLSGAHTWLVYPSLTRGVSVIVLKKLQLLDHQISFATLLIMFKGLGQDSVSQSLVNILAHGGTAVSVSGWTNL